MTKEQETTMTKPLPPEPTASLDDTIKSQRSKSYDPAKPLDPQRYEKFVIQVFRGVQKYQAYQAAISPGASKIRAGQGASHILRLPKIVQRLQYLLEKEVAAKVERSMDIQEMRAKLETIARFGTANEAVMAIKQLREWDSEDAERAGKVKRMDPAALCEYLAQFASHPARELEHIPGGLSGLMKRLIALTGASKESMIEALNEATDVKVDVKAPEEVEDKDDEDFPVDEETQDDETLVETIDAPAEGEPSEAMKEKLAPALEVAKELEAEDEKVEF